MRKADVLARFHAPTRDWFNTAFDAPTGAQRQGWPSILEGRSTLLFAPTGSGKTLAAFLAALDRLLFSPVPDEAERCRVLYVSPIKALAVDVERNLRAPLAGIAAAADRQGVRFHRPEVAIRSGDTAPDERARQKRRPPDILITTPESLFLLLTSNAREGLASVDTVIIDEIHAVAASKRGSHLFLSLERLEEVRAAALEREPRADRPPRLQRIGLSATQKPLEEIARLLGGGELDGDGRWEQRPVEIVDARERRTIELTLEVPVDDMAELARAPGWSPSGAPVDSRSIWPSIHPRLVELVRAHRSTMIFVNSRRLAERMAAALNETAGEEIALAHHGSLAREQRQQVEERLKSGELPCIVATSSLELGLDIGAVDLVVQIESPLSVSSGLQRIGRASHNVGGTSKGVLFPKHRADLLASTAAAARMRDAAVETTRYPRNPLDVLAQQLVGMVAMDTMSVDHAFGLVRRSAPFAELAPASFESVLDMLSGRYPSDDFAHLRPRVTWDRVKGTLQARAGAKQLAVVNAGTIPDRGLFGVFLDGDREGRTSRRVGELDEEMVFETREGEVVQLGASTWKITEITHDRVWVIPAPGEPGKMPFWKGDSVGRSRELGEGIGALARKVAGGKDDELVAELGEKHRLDARAASNLVRFVRDQQTATRDVPSDRTLVVERFIDELGDWRVCLLSPFGGRVHAPLAIAIAERARQELGIEVETTTSDDGIVVRFPESDRPPDLVPLLPAAAEVEELLVRAVGGTPLFASRFRECAGRALLLPRRHPGKRSPLWANRRRAASLLEVASQYGSFPILLETYRECLQDVFDLPGLQDVLQQIETRRIRVVTVDTRTASPFASSLLFSYVGNFMYEGDAPLAERRAQALSIDHAQLRELLGQAELRELLDPDAIADVERHLQRLEGGAPLAHADRVHDLLLSIGELSRDDLVARGGAADGVAVDELVQQLATARRVFAARIGGEERWVASEDAARYRDALGVSPARGLPLAFLSSVADPLGDLVSRYARTHGPFTSEDVARRFGIGVSPVRDALGRLVAKGRVVEGAFLRGGHGLEFCDAEVLRSIKRKTLAKLRAEVEPVPHDAYARFLSEWQGLERPRPGQNALLTAIEQLQGAPVLASVLEADVLPARVEGYRAGDLDALCAAGEVVWRGVEAVGASSGRIALYLAESFPFLAAPPVRAEGEHATKVRDALGRRGASFFADIVRETGMFAGDVHAALWALVWSGEVTNDTLLPLRSLEAGEERRRPKPGGDRWGAPITRRPALPGSEGRWSLLPSFDAPGMPKETERRVALARQLLERHGVLVREAVHAEGIVGGFSAVYDVLKGMEEAGRVRRGYFVAGLGATQFARPGAEDRLRALRDASEEPKTLVLSAADPGVPWGAALPWPEREGARPQRVAGAYVVVRDGRLLAWIGRSEQTLLTFFPEEDSARAQAMRAVAQALSGLVESGRRRTMIVATVDGAPVQESSIARTLADAGFVSGARGYVKRLGRPLPGEGGAMPSLRPTRGRFPVPPGSARGREVVEEDDEDLGPDF